MTRKLFFSILLLVATAQNATQAESGVALATVAARSSGTAAVASVDGVVEAVRQTVLAAQVAGAIVDLPVKVGDVVRAGQVLARIDARAADQSATASQAQVQAARASLDVSSKDFNRQKLLFQKGFISQGALDQSEAVYKAAEAGVNAQIAQAGAARTQTDFFTLRAPYNGIVAEVPVVQGDMAMPGRAIVTIYDPAALRVTATVPQSVAVSADTLQAARVELPGTAHKAIVPSRTTLLPTADPNTHTVQVRLDLPAGTRDAAPGMFARAWLPSQGGAEASRVFVPANAVVRRAEMTGVYVVDGAGRPALRQVRLGRANEGAVEVLSGLTAGELVATDPQAAARLR
jgi:RND family efflux transporter MFP subunit